MAQQPTSSQKNSGNQDSEHQANIYVTVDILRKLQYFAKGFSFLPQQPINSVLSGKNASRLRGRGLNFEELRHYRPGDDIRSMDWKVTRRTGKPHIKVYTEERERNVYLFIDQRASMFFGSHYKMKSVVAAELAALSAWRINEQGDRVGAIIFNDKEVACIPAKRGQGHVVNMLGEVVKKNHQLSTGQVATSTSESFNQALNKCQQVCGNNGLLMMMSDGYGWNQQSELILKKIRQHNDIIACHIADPLEQQLPTMSQMIVSDGARQIQFSSKDSIIRGKFKDKLNAELNAFAEYAKKYRIPLLSIDTISPTERQLRKALGGEL